MPKPQGHRGHQLPQQQDLPVQPEQHTTADTFEHSYQTISKVSLLKVEIYLRLIATISGIWVSRTSRSIRISGGGTAVVLGILGSIIRRGRCRSGRSSGRGRRTTTRSGRVVVAAAVAVLVVPTTTTTMMVISVVIVATPVVRVTTTSGLPLPITVIPRTVVLTRRAGLELFVLLLDVLHQVLAKLLGFLDHLGIGSSDVQVHLVLTLAAC